MSTEKLVKDLAKQLRNIGPKLAAKLVEAGIDSPEKIRRIGAKKSFEKSDYIKFKNSIMVDIKKRFDEEGIEIPFPQRTIHIENAEQAIAVTDSNEH